mmetsp:Transcript_89666/g.254199  ORF Transcript_89666/g.254199 Transcript_89666/m.254199 type:complete len:870 (+) Transcript_89666:86-2695(+)
MRTSLPLPVARARTAHGGHGQGPVQAPCGSSQVGIPNGTARPQAAWLPASVRAASPVVPQNTVNSSPPPSLAHAVLSPRSSLPTSSWPILPQTACQAVGSQHQVHAVGEPYQAVVLQSSALAWPPQGVQHECRWDPITPRSVHFSDSHGDFASVMRQLSAPQVRSPSRASSFGCLEQLDRSPGCSREPSPQRVTSQWSEAATPQHVTPRGSEAPTPRAPPPEQPLRRPESPKKRNAQQRVPPLRGPKKEPVSRTRGGSPRSTHPGGGGVARSPRDDAHTGGTASTRSPRDDVHGGHPHRGSTTDLVYDSSSRHGGIRAEEVANSVLQLQREVEDVRRDNSRLQEKLSKAKSLMSLVQRQADEAKDERDKERLRAESLQRSSQQLLRQLKREAAKVSSLERELREAKHSAHSETMGAEAPSTERGHERSLSMHSLPRSRETSGIGTSQVCDDIDFGRSGRGDGDNGEAEACFRSLGEVGSRINPMNAEATGGARPPEAICEKGGGPTVEIREDEETQRSWEFVMQGQHDPTQQQDFAPKIVSCYPDDAVEQALSRGVTCMCTRGRRLDNTVPNQDDFVAARHTLVHGGHIALYGVFDGHGPAGHHCAAFARGALPESLFGQRTLLLKPEDTLREAFRQTQESLLQQPFDTEHSGTTAALALVLSLPSPPPNDEAVQSGGSEAWLFVAHVGDSRAILASNRGGDTSAFTVTALTRDHRPEDPEEAERVRQVGGEIRKLRENSGATRVFAKNQDRPALALTRSLGASAALDAGVTAEPEVSAYRLRPGVDVLLILGTDGLFEFCNNSHAAGQILKEGVTAEALQALCANSRQQWARSSYNETVDDITVIAAALPAAGPPSQQAAGAVHRNND